MNKKNILISIVVPIYNVEKYLRKCIDSILNQSHFNIEIILVEDGSPDNCAYICDEYYKKDKRIKVVHKKNGGLSDARNVGINESTGEYLMFVDSDDYIAENMCEILLDKALKYQADIVSCNFKEVFLNNRFKINEQNLQKDEIVYSNLEMIEKYFFSYTVDKNVIWNKLYKRKLFYSKEKLLFPKGILHEDNYLIYKLYYYANKIVCINDVLYYYLRRNDSITSFLTEKNIVDSLKGQLEQFNFVKNKDNKLFNMVIAKNIDEYFYYNSLNKKTENINKYLRLLRKHLLEEYKISNPYITVKRQLKYICIFFNINVNIYKKYRGK